MSGLTVERLEELRRIAKAATPGPWAWRMSKDGRMRTLEAHGCALALLGGEKGGGGE